MLGEIDADARPDTDGLADADIALDALVTRDAVEEPDSMLDSVVETLTMDDLVPEILKVATALTLALPLTILDGEFVKVDLPEVADGTAELDIVFTADVVVRAVARGVGDTRALVVEVDSTVTEFAEVFDALSRVLADAYPDAV